MAFSAFFGLRFQQFRSLAKWIVIVVPMAAAVGSLVALFLWSLDRATELRFEFPWLIYGMPVAGFAMVWAYQKFGKSAEGGNNLIVDQVHEPGRRRASAHGALHPCHHSVHPFGWRLGRS